MTKTSFKTYALCSSALVALAYSTSAQAQEPAAEEVVVTGSRIITNGFAQPTPVTVLTMEQMRQTAPDSLVDAVLQLPQFRSSFQPSSTAFNPGSSSNVGASFVNLRGLGPVRGLTLLNGERIVATAGTNQGNSVDINTLPQMLMRKVDVVTGGASAAYGSDALSGVTNFVLDTKFTGIKGEVRGGITRYGDNGSVGASLAAGKALFNGRGRVIGSYEYFRTTGIKGYGSGNRDWALSQVGVYANAACPTPQTSTSCPTRIITGPIFPASFSSGGIITASTVTGAPLTQLGVPTATAPANPLTFIGGSAGTSNAGVTTIPFPFGTQRTNTTAAAGQMIGGGIDVPLGQYMNYIPVNLRHSAYARFEYDLVPDNWTVHADLMYGWSASKFRGQIQTATYTIHADNPFLPASIANILNTAPLGATAPNLYNPATGLFNGARVNTITVSRVNTDWGPNLNAPTFSTLRFSSGIDGHFDAFGKTWNVTGYYTHGRGGRDLSSPNNAQNIRIWEATDVVRSPGGAGLAAAGTPICRSTITVPGNGCVPLNVIGQNTATPEALAYIRPAGGNSTSSQVLKQDVVDVSMRGEPFSTWAGPVSFGAGAAYRRESVVSRADPISTQYLPAIPGTTAFKPGLTAPLTLNGTPAGTRGTPGSSWNLVNNGAGPPGSLNVKEVFVETLIPLAKDMPFAKQFDLNLAFRYADYQFGGGVKNWKVGVSYRPVDDLRIRSTLSKDVRAPNLANLFAPIQVTLAGSTDPFRLGTTGQPEAAGGGNSISGGNPNLKPETGKTFTVGAVVTPRWIPGLTMSVDYFQIIVTDAIQGLAIGTVINQCYNGNTSLCSFITRNPDPAGFGAGNTVGPITQVFLPVLNAGEAKLAGLDIEASYTLPLNRIWEGRKDTFSVRAVFNYQAKNQTHVLGSSTVSTAVGTIAGGIIQGTGGNYDWGGTFNFNYRNGPLTINWQQRFINESRINNTVDENGVPYPFGPTVLKDPGPNPANGLLPATVPVYWYSDISFNYKFGPNQRYEGFLNIQNAFDKDPPMLGSVFAQGVIPTNNSVYNGVGRSYTAGVRFKF